MTRRARNGSCLRSPGVENIWMLKIRNRENVFPYQQQQRVWHVASRMHMPRVYQLSGHPLSYPIDPGGDTGAAEPATETTRASQKSAHAESIQPEKQPQGDPFHRSGARDDQQTSLAAHCPRSSSCELVTAHRQWARATEFIHQARASQPRRPAQIPKGGGRGACSQTQTGDRQQGVGRDLSSLGAHHPQIAPQGF